MGLASALSTSLTGLTAAETTIDVVGNNLANASTVGFKASQAVFSTQFLQTEGLGSGPTTSNGGTNPRQVGLGTQVAEITPNFTQGTVQISSNPSDLALQGDGFFIVQGNSGEQLYTRNGEFKTNSQNQLVSTGGNRLLGYGVDADFSLVTTTLQPLSIPLGSAAVAQATKNVNFQGTLSPTGAIATKAQIVQSGVLGDASFNAPATGTTNSIAVAPIAAGITTAGAGVGAFPAGIYGYKVVFVDAAGQESDAASFSANVGAGTAGIDVNNIPTDGTGKYVGRRLYRTQVNPGGSPTYFLSKDVTDNTTSHLNGSAFGIDSTSDAVLATQSQLNTSTINGNYSYYVTFTKPGVEESRPSPLIGPQNVSSDRVVLSNIPTPGGDYAGGQVRIYRNLSTDPSTFYHVADVIGGTSYVDHVSDATISNSATPGFKALDLNGPKITTNTRLVDVLSRNGSTYDHPFDIGSLAFTGHKGGRALATQNLAISATTTVQDLVNFMTQVQGIQAPSNDPQNPIPIDASGTPPGGSVINGGKIQFVANNGVDSAIDIPLTSFKLTTAGGQTTPSLGFGATQTAVGAGAVTDFIAYDSLGIAVNVRVTVELESRNSASTTYRWYGDSPDNNGGNGLAVGTGLIKFDGTGSVFSVTNDKVNVNRSSVSAISPLGFSLDFSKLSGLAGSANTLAAASQDGSGAGTLSSFLIGQDGTIKGNFSNGISRTLGQVRLARFGNPAGLQQKGGNLFSTGTNSGLPIEGNPGQQGIGTLVSGAVELSNTDIGKNLIDLILASTAYRGNTRVVTTTQQLFDELLALKR